MRRKQIKVSRCNSIVLVFKMWIKVVILQALLHHSMAEVFTMCLDARTECRYNVPEKQIRCQHGIADFQKFEYVLGKQSLSMCCAGLQYKCREPNKDHLQILRNRCTKKQACSIPLEINETNDETVDLSCGYEGQHYKISQIEIVYTCLSGLKANGKTLRATGDSNVNGDTGGTSVVVITVASVLAVLAIVVVIIVALIVYKRRSQRKTQERNNNTSEENRESQVNNGFEGEYNIIPAEYDIIPNTSFQVLDDVQSDNGHDNSINARKPSGKYSTIVLNDDDSETDKSTYSHYDKANLRKNYNAEKERDSENIHTYSHFNETSDDYNRMASTNSSLGVDEDYPNFGSKVKDDYSHLNYKKDTADSPNDYNVLVTKVKQNAPEKHIASYKQLVVKSASNPKNEETSITGYETPVNLERSETYEAPNTNHVSNEKLKRVDSYEKPVNLELNFKANTPMKRVDSYERPVLKSTSNSKNEQTFVTGYETPVYLERSKNYEMNDNYLVSHEKLKRVYSYEKPVNLELDLKPNAPMKRVDSYEQPVLKSTSNSKNEQTFVTDYETPIYLERSENYEVNDNNHVSHEKLKRVDSYEKPVNLEPDLKPNAPMKRVDSYEQPVLKSTSNSKNEQTFVTDYETPVYLERSENYEVNDNNHVSHEKMKRVDSYEQPVCMSKTKVENTQYNEQKDSHRSCDNYETPVSLKRKPSIDSEPENNVRL